MSFVQMQSMIEILDNHIYCRSRKFHGKNGRPEWQIEPVTKK